MPAIKKAVFPVAGLGTRFLPATKAIPKEMLPILDRPLIEYAVKEAVAAGISELIFVTSGYKRAIEDHFDSNFELEENCRLRQKFDALEILESIVPKGVHCIYIRQEEALGLGHAILCAKPVVGNDPFAVLLADDFLIGDNAHMPLLSMVEQFEHSQAKAVLATDKVEADQIDQYGMIEIIENKVVSIVEKPPVGSSASRDAVIGRYVLDAQIFDFLEHIGTGAGGEIQLTDALDLLMKENTVLHQRIKARRFDCGSKLGYVLANLEVALLDARVGSRLRSYIKQNL